MLLEITELFENLGIHRKVLAVFFIVLNQFAQFIHIQRQIIFGRIAFRIRSLEFFKRTTDSGRLQNSFFNLYPQGFG